MNLLQSLDKLPSVNWPQAFAEIDKGDCDLGSGATALSAKGVGSLSDLKQNSATE